jgi:acetylornithine deacetylase/succinyl-diaminopimelate desuccinylase-like protein
MSNPLSTRSPRVLLLAVCAATAVAAAPAAAQQRELTRHEALARDVLRELVAINTTHSVGDNTAAAHAMAARLLAAGFPPEDVHVLEPAPRKGNLVARLRGRDTGLKPILLLAHLDVVEANPADWTLPPFELTEQDGHFFGRGVADDKDEVAFHVVNLIRMKEEGFVPNRDIIIALTADEEGGTHNGVRWLLANHRELVDAAFTINEGGGGVIENGRRVANAVGAAEKRVANFTVEATNPGGHSSVPREDNAIYDLAEALTRLGRHRMPVRLNEVSRAHFERSAALVSAELGAAMRALVADSADERAIALLQMHPRYNSMMRTTCVATMLEGGHASNALPQRARATVNCRLLPDERPQDVRAALQAAAGDRVTVTGGGTGGAESPPSPLTREVMAPIERITRELWDLTVVPVMGTGATDNRFFRAAGIPGYGVSGTFYGDANAHGMNERIPVAAFYEALEFLYRLTKAYASPP